MRRRSSRAELTDAQRADLLAQAQDEADTLHRDAQARAEYVAAFLAQYGTDAIECIRSRRRLRGAQTSGDTRNPSRFGLNPDAGPTTPSN